MLSHELLVSKGFSLNEYPEGKYYEFSTTDDDVISNILDDEYMGDEEKVILQLKENFSNKLICVDGNVWNLPDAELDKILDKMNILI